MKIRIGVIFGGKSVEHEVSVISAIQAMEYMDDEKYEIVPIYINKNLEWYSGLMLKDIDSFKDSNLIKKYAKRVNLVNKKNRFVLQSTGFFKREVGEIDLAFPIVHGLGIEDGCIQGYLELLGIPYIGSNIYASAVGQDKVFQKQILNDMRIPIANYVWFFDTDYHTNKEEIFKKIDKLGYPVVVKPACLGSSIGITKVNNKSELASAIDEALNYDVKIVVEEAIPNLIEVNSSVLGNYEKMTVSVLEEVIKNDDILSYKDKYISGGKSSKGMASSRRIIPARIPSKLVSEIEEMSRQTFRALNNSGVVRIDYLVDSKKNKAYVNEINTIPGSLAFYLWTPKEIEYPELIDKLVDIAIKNYKKKSRMTFSFETNILSGYNGGLKGIKK